MLTARSHVLRLSFLIAGLLGLPTMALAAPLLVFAVSGRGVALALGLLALSAGLLGLPFALGSRGVHRWRQWSCGLLLLAGAAGVAAVPWTGPSGQGGDAALRIEHSSTRARDASTTLPSASWLPEADLVSLGIGLAPFIDPLIDRPAAARLMSLVMPKYESLQVDPALRELGSGLGSCFRELCLQRFDDGHALAIVPRDGARATLLFLHGAAGNFAAYWQALAPLARRDGIALVFPGFGAGNRDRPGGVEAVLAARDTACEQFALAPDRVFLAALSNGGLGASGVLARGPPAFRGVALISAVVAEEHVAMAAAAGSLRGLPVLLVHGDADDRVPLAALLPAIGKMESAGATITRRVYPGADHFLPFARLGEILGELSRWILQPPIHRG
jgi:pimeloyl-ACP methyl ester carboxylesterase